MLFARAAIVPVLCALAFAQSSLERAATLARDRHYAEASQAIKSAAEPTPQPQRIAFHRLKAAIAAGLNKAAEAADEMRQALALSPEDPALLLATALAEHQAQESDATLHHAQAVPASPIAQTLIGNIQEQRGAIPDAIAAYREAVRLDPAREDYRITLAFTLIRHQTQAIPTIREALTTFPGSARLHTLLGIAQYAESNTEDAIATLSRAISLDPAADPAYRSLTQIVLQSSAAPDPKIVAQLCPWNAIVCAALKLREARDTDNANLMATAIATLEEAPPDNPIAACELARAREWTNHLPEARLPLETCVARDPSPQNHFRLGLLYQRLGLTALAQAQMEERGHLLTRMSEQTAASQAALAAAR